MANLFTWLPGDNSFVGETSATRCFGSCCFKHSTAAAFNQYLISFSWTKDLFPDIFRQFSFYIQSNETNIYFMIGIGGKKITRLKICSKISSNLQWRKVRKQDLYTQYCVSFKLHNFLHFLPSAGFVYQLSTVLQLPVL